MWTSKIGNVGKPLLLGLTHEGDLVDFEELSGPGGTGAPQLRLRPRTFATDTTLSFDVEAYDGDLEGYNAQVTFTDFTGIEARAYLVEVDASFGGQDITFPEDGHIEIGFVESLD